MIDRILAAAAVVALGSGAMAQDANTILRAEQLGSILGSEAACDLNLSQPGIEAWIASNVPDTDMTFASFLGMESKSTERHIGDMSDSEKTAHCAAVRQAAKKAGLIE